MRLSQVLFKEWEDKQDGPVSIAPEYATREVQNRLDRQAGWFLVAALVLFVVLSAVAWYGWGWRG